jgi:hypothetical protein
MGTRNFRISVLIFILPSLFLPARAQADFYLYGAIGTALQFPGSARVGFTDWEAGLLNSSAIGVDKVFRLNHGFYAAFGPALAIGKPVGVGFYGGFGVECNLLWGLTFRGEMNAVGAHNGFSQGELNAGLGLHF